MLFSLISKKKKLVQCSYVREQSLAGSHLVVSQHLLQSTVTVGNVAHTVAAEGRRPESVSSIGVDVRGDPTAKGKGGQRVVMCKQYYGMDQLSQGPAMLLRLQ